MNDKYVAVPREDWEGILDSVRGKTGKTALLKSGEVSAEIDGIQQGGDLPEEAFVITGDCSYRFAGGWDWFIDKYGSKITTKDITGATRMFNTSQITRVPFDINFQQVSLERSASYIFYGAPKLEEVPKINILRLANGFLSYSFYGCERLRNLPTDIGSWFNWENTPANFYEGSYVFYNCLSLRKIPDGLFGHDKTSLTSLNYSSLYWYWSFRNCYVLDEIYLPLPECFTTGILTSNSLNNSFVQCSRLKRVVFATQDDGTPYSVKWKGQTIDLSIYVGYAYNKTWILNYNSGITADKCITADNINDPDATNDPDAFAVNVEYSRYNHDSAVATINSLPDTSAYLATAGGTNTIKFNGASGSGTAGGAINTLTAEEIAVATAKGWTVTLA